MKNFFFLGKNEVGAWMCETARWRAKMQEGERRGVDEGEGKMPKKRR